MYTTLRSLSLASALLFAGPAAPGYLYSQQPTSDTGYISDFAAGGLDQQSDNCQIAAAGYLFGVEYERHRSNPASPLVDCAALVHPTMLATAIATRAP